jgi:hypothetical protein
MPLDSFDDFTKMISEVPDSSIVKTFEWKCNKILNELSESQWGLTAEAYSLLYFRLFLRAAKHEQPLHGVVPVPPHHIEFYEDVIARLLKAKALPFSALERFHQTFVPAK